MHVQCRLIISLGGNLLQLSRINFQLSCCSRENATKTVFPLELQGRHFPTGGNSYLNWLCVTTLECYFLVLSSTTGNGAAVSILSGCVNPSPQNKHGRSRMRTGLLMECLVLHSITDQSKYVLDNLQGFSALKYFCDDPSMILSIYGKEWLCRNAKRISS